MFEWAGKPVSRSFKLEIKRAVHTLSSFLGTGYAHLPDDAWVRSLLDGPRYRPPLRLQGGLPGRRHRRRRSAAG